MEKEGENKTMITVLDRREARGRENLLIDLIRKKASRNMAFDQIVAECESTPEEIRPYYDEIIRKRQASCEETAGV